MNTPSQIQRRSANRWRRGGAAVETALVLPLVLMFLFGILEYGRYVMMLQVLTNAAREGARYAQIHTQPVTVGGTTSGNASSDVYAVINKALAGQQLSGQTVSIYASNSTGTSLGSWNNAQTGQSVCVEITGNYPVVISNFIKLPLTIPVTARAVMRSESN
ncbi:MAG: TadE/TadG family type IV pilus assembly protein [Pirellulales bacterium]